MFVCFVGWYLQYQTLNNVKCRENPNSSVYCKLSISHQITKYLTPIRDIKISDDGKTLITATEKEVVAWDIVTEIKKQSIKFNTQGYAVRTIAVAPDNLVAIGDTNDNSIKMWRTDKNTQTLVKTQHSDGIFNLAVSPNGKILVSAGGTDGLVQVWSLETGKLKYNLKRNHTTFFLINDSYVNQVKISPDGKILVTINGGEINLWNLNNGDFISALSDTVDPLTSTLVISPDSKWLAVSGGKIWDLKTGNMKKSLGNILTEVISIAFLPNKLYVIGIQKTSNKSDVGKFLNIWNVETGELEFSQPTYGSILAVAPDGKTIIAASSTWGNPIEVWSY